MEKEFLIDEHSSEIALLEQELYELIDAVYATGNKWVIENFNATHN